MYCVTNLAPKKISVIISFPARFAVQPRSWQSLRHLQWLPNETTTLPTKPFQTWFPPQGFRQSGSHPQPIILIDHSTIKASSSYTHPIIGCGTMETASREADESSGQVAGPTIWPSTIDHLRTTRSGPGHSSRRREISPEFSPVINYER